MNRSIIAMAAAGALLAALTVTVSAEADAATVRSPEAEPPQPRGDG